MWAPPPAVALGAVKAALILFVLPAPSQAVVRAVLDSNSSTVDFAALPAMFGAPLVPEGVRGYLTEAKPANACRPIQGPRPAGNGSRGAAIVLIRRHDCAFDLKVLHAQRAGFGAAIVHNVRSDALVLMAHAHEELRRRIAIPAVFVGEAASRDLRVIMRCDASARVLLLPGPPPWPHLDCRPALAVSWVLLGRALALLAATFFVLRRLCGWLRARRSRGPAAVTAPAGQKKAQVRTFTRLRDLCAICLDEYEEGDQIKVLPCSHTYHCQCIDPWFSQAAQRSCPMCKQSVAGSEDSASWEDSAASTVESQSVGGEDPMPPGRQLALWAVQARLRSRRLELLARAGPHRPCSAASVWLAELERPPDP